jgi:hypothetical protein
MKQPPFIVDCRETKCRARSLPEEDCTVYQKATKASRQPGAT